MKAVAVSERSFQQDVLYLAALCRWTAYHTHDSRRSHRGFPDLVLVRPPRVIFAELKAERGRVQPEQESWLALLGCCPGVEAYLWRPSDRDRIEALLRRAS